MLRKVYIDFVKNKIKQKDFSWLFKRSWQYFIIQVSFLTGKPLCGPVLGTLVTNYTCNYRCRMCDLPARDEVLRKRGLKEFTTEQLKAVLREFAELGTGGIGFTGGEPMLRKDIFELLKYTKQLNMFSHLNTNGFFINAETAEKIFEAGVDSVNISLDGSNAKTHDTIRNHPGAFDKVIKGAECIRGLQGKKRAPVRLKFVTVINKTNIDEAPEILKLAKSLGADCVEFIPEQPFAEDSNSLNKDIEFLNKVTNLTNYLLEGKRKGENIENSPAHIKLFKNSFCGEKFPLPCYAAYNSYAVDCYGEVYPCVPWFNWDRSIGSITKTSLKKFWYSQEFNRQRKRINLCRDCYLNCQAELNILFNMFNTRKNRKA